MKWSRIAGLSGRVMLQVFRDKRAIILLIVIPVVLLVIADLLFKSDGLVNVIGVVNHDHGVSLQTDVTISLADGIEKGIDESEILSYIRISDGETVDFLEAGRGRAVLVMPKGFTAGFLQSGKLVLDLKLEGSNPSLTGSIIGQMNQVAIAALARLTTSGAIPGSLFAGSGEQDELPVRVEVEYLYGGPEYEVMDYVAPVYIAFLVLFFVFLITCVSLIHERTHGTMERLLATPVTRIEIIAGYMIGLGVYALLQGALILLFSLFVLNVNYAGSLWILFLIIVILSIAGVALGMLASSFARNEFQVVLFIPLLIIPQLLLSGAFMPVKDLPTILRLFAYCMPLTYANIALRDVMIKGWGLARIYPNLLILAGFAALFILVDVLAVKKEVD